MASEALEIFLSLSFPFAKWEIGIQKQVLETAGVTHGARPAQRKTQSLFLPPLSAREGVSGGKCPQHRVVRGLWGNHGLAGNQF